MHLGRLRRSTGRELCEGLLERGVLAKDTHGSTIRLAPPLVASEDDIDLLLQALGDTLVAARGSTSRAEGRDRLPDEHDHP